MPFAHSPSPALIRASPTSRVCLATQPIDWFGLTFGKERLLTKQALRNTALLSLVVCSGVSNAQVIWDEGVNGDLSDNRLAPTDLTLLSGTNSLIATSGGGDREYVHFVLSPGLALAHINVVSWSGIDQTGFIGVQAGTTFTEPPTGTNVANLLGWSHYGPGVGNLGSDILPAIGQGAGAIGFTPPLSGPNFTFWLNQTSSNRETYQLDFVTSPVPEPASIGLFVVGLAAMIRRRRSGQF